MNEKQIFDKVMQLIKESGMTLLDISDITEIPYQTLLYQKKNKNFPVKELTKILNAIGKRLDIADDNKDIKNELKNKIGGIIDDVL
jgi:predicted transcriptional regulator